MSSRLNTPGVTRFLVPPPPVLWPRPTVSVDARWKKLQPLGIYAPPEQRSRSIDPEHVARGLSIQVGDLHDDLRFLDHIDEWRRPLAQSDCSSECR